MMATKKLVVGVEFGPNMADIGKEASAALPPGRRYRYAREATLTLDDGSKERWTVSGKTKPSLKQSEISLSENIQKRMVSLEWYEFCERPSMSISYYIGPRSMEKAQ